MRGRAPLPRATRQRADVHRLSGADSLFIFNETPAHPQHTLKIAIVDPTSAVVPVTFDAFHQQMREAVDLLEPLRWLLVPSPANLGHPSWVETTVEDLATHLHRLTLPPPGGRRELCAAISGIAELPLDRTRPLWEVWFVDGLRGGGIAYVAKIHHAVADGISSGELLAAAFTAEPGETPIADHSAVADRFPTRREQWHETLGEIAEMTRRLPRLLAQTMIVARRARRFRRGAGRDAHAKPFAGPHTCFDAPLTPRRAFAYESFDLAAVKAVGRAHGASVTDVLLAMAGGALRRYLLDRGGLPDRTLTAAVPVSVRGADEHHTWGNRVASWYLPLATDVVDPLDRLRAVSTSAHDARAELAATDPELQHAWAEYWRLFRLVTFGLPRVVRRFVRRPSYNAIVSSVRASGAPLYRHGARLDRLISVGPLVEGIGINFTAWSYAGELTVAILVCADHVDDVWDLARALRSDYDELLSASGAGTG